MEEKKDNKIKLDEEVRISHRNILWLIYRALSEDVNINTTKKEDKDNVWRKTDE